MEHIVQFAIGMDDEAIKAAVEKNAEKTIIEGIRKDVEAKLFQTSYYGKTDKNQLAGWVERKVEEFLNDNKDTILELAADKLADKLLRTKAARELLGQIAPSSDNRRKEG